MKKIVIQFGVFCIAICLIIFPCLFLILTGTATMFISDFAVDSNERLYIGMPNGILVYEDGVLVNSINPNTSRGYAFTIDENDNILLSTSTKVYWMDLDGNILGSQEDPGAHIFNQIQYSRGKFVSANGNEYQIEDFLGWTCIRKNELEIVYRISTPSLMVKILMFICVILLFVFPVCFAVKHKV